MMTTTGHGDAGTDSGIDRYAVIGHPIEHSRSPFIHARFAEQTGQAMTYGRILAPLDGFGDSVRTFIAQGGKGLNVTVPFKLEAHALAGQLSPRAEAAGAVNTLRFEAGRIEGDNTDGIGLVRDIEQRLGRSLRGRRVLLLGAGGAARGALLPLLACAPAQLFVANRTAANAEALLTRFSTPAAQYGVVLAGGGWAAVPDGFDVVINATAGSLQGEAPPLGPRVFADGALAYDMMYGAQPTVFMRFAAQRGADTADGLGMLVEQAAESFSVWRGVRPDTTPVLAELRQRLAAGREA